LANKKISYEFIILELNITIKFAPETTKYLPFFTDYIGYWKVIYKKTKFFKFFKSNDGFVRNKIFDKQPRGL
jgi:hypothetical protein